MSRSFGAILFTTLPPIRSSPSVMSSRPAIMFSVVDFPQPDGPTRITNSPSAMSRLILSTASAPSGKRFVTWSRTMSATISPHVLALDGTGSQPSDDPALEEQKENEDRDRDDGRGSGNRPGRRRELRTAAEERQRRRSRSRADRRGERDREEKLVPAEQEHQDGRGHHARRSQRSDHPRECLERSRAVHLGCLLELPGDLPEEGRQDVDAKRQAERDVRGDQSRPCVEQAERPLNVEHRRDQRDRREHGYEQRHPDQDLLAGEVE